MNTETLDKMYLEWSQFTKAKTARELMLESLLRDALTQLCRTLLEPTNTEATAKVTRPLVVRIEGAIDAPQTKDKT